jgi:hypothetical protein
VKIFLLLILNPQRLKRTLENRIARRLGTRSQLDGLRLHPHPLAKIKKRRRGKAFEKSPNIFISRSFSTEHDLHVTRQNPGIYFHNKF